MFCILYFVFCLEAGHTCDDDDDEEEEDNDDDEEIGEVFPFSFSNLDAFTWYPYSKKRKCRNLWEKQNVMFNRFY